MKGVTLEQLRQRFRLRKAEAETEAEAEARTPEERAQNAIAKRLIEGRCPSCVTPMPTASTSSPHFCPTCSFTWHEGHVPSIGEIAAHREARFKESAQAALLERARVRQVNAAKMAAARAPIGKARWAITKDAGGDDDAILQFGKYAGRSVSELAADRDGYTYLTWMRTQDFPSDLMEIVDQQIIKATTRR